MSNAFISYCAQSRDAVKTLAQDIRALDHHVWYDQELLGGHAWWDRILEEIRACDVFVFALAPQALDSIPCRLEYTYASSLGKPILPVMVADGVAAELLPPALSSVQFIDYRGSDKRGAFALVKALAALPPPKPLPDQLPVPPALPGSFLGALKQRIDEGETLDFHEQSALVMKLKDRLRDPEQAAEVRKLLLRLRQRDDLYSKVADEIDSVLGRPRAPLEEVERPQPSIDARAPDVAKLVDTLQPSSSLSRRIGRFLLAAAAGFALAFLVAASQGTRYLNSADLWEVHFWFIWPATTFAVAIGFWVLSWMFRAVMRPWR